MTSRFQMPPFVLCIALAFGAVATVDASVLDNSLIGSWDLIGFSDGGVDAVTTGTAVFGDDHTFSFVGTITFPSEPADSISVSGTYEEAGDSVVLTIEQTPSTWTLLFSDPIVVLTAVEPPPANTITLRRQTTPAALLSWGRLKAIFR